jgi:starch-binding outer membrane protein, SusD/RagB family
MSDHPIDRTPAAVLAFERCTRVIGRAAIMAAGVAFALSTAACDFEVTNPGPVQADNLDDPGAFPSIINGIQRALINALNYTALQGAAVTRELFPTGQTGQFGIEPSNSVGRLEEDEQGEPWSGGQQARWLGESAIERFERVLGADASSDRNTALAYLWAGYANRLMGENMCNAVFNGGPAEDPAEYLSRAKEQFSQAITIGGAAGDASIVAAAYAGRASVEVQQGDWSAATADAGHVATDFTFRLRFYNIGDDYQQNRIAWASMNQPYKAHSQWNTWYADYFDATADPRVTYRRTNDVGTGALECCGVIAWWPQMKYGRADPIDLSTGTEMRLVEAEGLLRENQLAQAVAKIDEVRATAGVAPIAPASMADAWWLLKRERGIDLWLEGRRLGDLRRWEETNTPGALDPKEVVSEASHLQSQNLCFPISKAERDRNPNIG